MSKLELNLHKSVRNPDFARRNIIAAEIEKVIDALASQSLSRAEFLKKLDRFLDSSPASAPAEPIKLTKQRH